MSKMKRQHCPECGKKMILLSGNIKRWICDSCGLMFPVKKTDG